MVTDEVLTQMLDECRAGSQSVDLYKLLSKVVNVKEYREKVLQTYSYESMYEDLGIELKKLHEERSETLNKDSRIVENILTDELRIAVGKIEITGKLSIVQELEIVRANDTSIVEYILELLEDLIQLSLKKKFINDLGDNVDDAANNDNGGDKATDKDSFEVQMLKAELRELIEDLTQSLAILGMLSHYKSVIVESGKFISIGLSLQKLILEGLHLGSKKSFNSFIGLMHQTYILLILNTVRSNDYDIIPSKSYSYGADGKNEDFAYQQQVELKNMLRTSSGKSTLSFLMISDGIYDYGEEENIRKIRDQLILDIGFMKFAKTLFDNLSTQSMIPMHYMCELGLWMVYTTSNRAYLVQNGILSFMLNLITICKGFISSDNKVVKECYINLAQSMAKGFITTNPKLIESYTIMSGIPIMVKNLLEDKVHHMLLHYEGLLALTNLSSYDIDMRRQIVQAGVWNSTKIDNDVNIKELLMSENNDVNVAAIELMNNISTDDIIQENLVNQKGKLELKIFAQKLKFYSTEFKDEYKRPRLAILSFLAANIDLESVQDIIKEYDLLNIETNSEDEIYRLKYIQSELEQIQYQKEND